MRSNDRRKDPCDGADRMKMPPPRPMPHGEPTTVGCELGSNTSPFDDGADGREVSGLAGAAAMLAAPGCLRMWSASASSAAVRLLDGEPLCPDMVVHGRAVGCPIVSCAADRIATSASCAPACRRLEYRHLEQDTSCMHACESQQDTCCLVTDRDLKGQQSAKGQPSSDLVLRCIIGCEP